MELLIPALGAVIGVVLFILLLSTVLIISRKRSNLRKNDQLFGSTVKVAQGVPPFLPIAVQPDKNSIRSWQSSQQTSIEIDGLSGPRTRDVSKERVPDKYNWKVWLKVQYLASTQHLEIALFRAKCYPEFFDPTSLSFLCVCLYIMPEEQVQQTNFYQNNGSPSIDESFMFPVSQSDLSDKQVRVSLYEMNESRTRSCLGHALVKLGELRHLHDGESHYLTKDMNTLELASDPVPEVHVSLSYDTGKEKLKIQIFAARNMPEDATAGHRFYLRTNVIVGTKSAKVKRSNLSNSIYGVFQCTYAFQVPTRLVDACCIQFSLITVQPETGKEVVLGSFVIGPCVYAHGAGLEHWKSMLSNCGRCVEMWHKLAIVQ